MAVPSPWSAPRSQDSPHLSLPWPCPNENVSFSWVAQTCLDACRFSTQMHPAYKESTPHYSLLVFFGATSSNSPPIPAKPQSEHPHAMLGHHAPSRCRGSGDPKIRRITASRSLGNTASEPSGDPHWSIYTPSCTIKAYKKPHGSVPLE